MAPRPLRSRSTNLIDSKNDNGYLMLSSFFSLVHCMFIQSVARVQGTEIAFSVGLPYGERDTDSGCRDRL